MSRIPPGSTVSLVGRPFLSRCMDCRRLIIANALAWFGDFAGDRSGQATYPVRCTDCAKARRK